MTRLVTAIAAVVGYVALMLAITAGIELRERNAFHDAPTQYASFVAALDSGSATGTRAVARWFREHAPSSSRASASISLGADAAEDGETDLARRFTDDVAAKIEQDQRALDEKSARAWSRAVPWLVAGAILTAATLFLRHRRRAANAEVVELVDQYVPPRPLWRRPVFLVVSGIGYTLLVGGFFAVVAATRANELPWAARGFLLAGGVVALPAAYFVLRYSRPRAARGAAQALRADWRKPVLYLRGFGDDPDAAVVDELPGALSAGLLSIHSREEHLIGALGAFGPVVAVGRPGEQLPHLGAARFYLPGDDWQSGVLRLMELSQLIVLRLGDGEGVWWEVDQARATQPPRKLVLLIPGDRPDLAERLDAHLPIPARLDKAGTLPGRWTSAVVVFDTDWTPRVQPVGPFPGEKNRNGAPVFYVARAMQQALRSIGAHKRAMGLRINSHMLAVYGKVLLLVPGLFLVVYFLRLIFLW
ncbi:transferase [Lentzea sp. PSKA42]|uniref:Transferase n=1 Tax=Lentzea indica TaxID=2604800 RepID=A0ABX1FDU8_9PSEU|nr:transferase [Lentzea indica]NKE57012.1 transferase [Lentzea indica]